ncbi:MAG TPA: hypothetical protein VGL60_03590 [Acidimicrobiales bacterium]
MARHSKERSLVAIAGSLLHRDPPDGPGRRRPARRHAGNDRSPAPSRPLGQGAGEQVPLSGTCSCGRQRNDVVAPGVVGDRWFRHVFTQCECGEVLMLTIGRRAER